MGLPAAEAAAAAAADEENDEQHYVREQLEGLGPDALQVSDDVAPQDLVS